MSSHAATLAVYLVLAGLGVVLQLLSLRPGSSVPSLGGLLTRVMRARSGRVGVLAGWLWLGLHFFAR